MKKIVDEQNGFRKSRSTTDHSLSLTSIIDTRKKIKKSTLCASLILRKHMIPLIGTFYGKDYQILVFLEKMFSALKSLYVSVRSCVRVN